MFYHLQFLAFIHSYKKCILNNYYVPGTVLDARDMVTKKADLVLGHGFYSLFWGSRQVNSLLQCSVNIGTRAYHGKHMKRMPNWTWGVAEGQGKLPG